MSDLSPVSILSLEASLLRVIEAMQEEVERLEQAGQTWAAEAMEDFEAGMREHVGELRDMVGANVLLPTQAQSQQALMVIGVKRASA
ncbi:hypothetical protein [Poseidonocella sp. HB161398]|uniref:hypothetical protein n=1 Tax=Poseidonocella sp. HB161398 TaxID=2320855 RepID=UPI001108A5F2|nr:hypothetical protein [Poseidonocella sp. HB161398]